ncbi:MAG TPA: cytochrome c oxidase subunit 3 [Opitutaceae bacterium]
MNNKALDVSALPESALDHRSLIWWGNTLLLVIETTMFALLVASFLYVRMNFPIFPPVLTTRPITILHPFPELARPTMTLLILIVSVIPAILADRLALRMNSLGVRVTFGILVLFGIVAAISRFYDLHSFLFVWSDNAYASVVWTIASLHLMHIIVATSENTAMLLWAMTHPLDRKHARDVRVSAVYWYWVVGIWIPLYLLIYFGPRIL